MAVLTTAIASCYSSSVLLLLCLLGDATLTTKSLTEAFLPKCVLHQKHRCPHVAQTRNQQQKVQFRTKESLSSPSFLLHPLADKFKKLYSLHAKTDPHVESNEQKNNHDDDTIFLLSFDGTLANTARHNSKLAIQAARKTWPALSPPQDDEDWLVNKMTALSHVISTHITDAVLLARLLLEEQQLDQGRSVGATGKYASRFHPSSGTPTQPQTATQSTPTTATKTNDGRKSTRPLTVGEIAVNWLEGACLKETLLARYHVNYTSPLGRMEENLVQVTKDWERDHKGDSNDPTLHLQVAEAVAKSFHKVYILVNHASHVQLAHDVLQQVLPTGELSTKGLLQSGAFPESTTMSKENHRCSRVEIVYPADRKDRQLTGMDMVGKVMRKSRGSTYHVIHSSWEILEDTKRLFGHESPYKSQVLPTILDIHDQESHQQVQDDTNNSNVHKTQNEEKNKSNKKQMSLHLPLWADNTDAQQHRSAEMDPWIHVMNLDELSDLLLSRTLHAC